MSFSYNPDKAPDNGDTTDNTIVRNILLCVAVTLLIVAVLERSF